MKATELIQQLQALVAEHGDLPVEVWNDSSAEYEPVVVGAENVGKKWASIRIDPTPE